MISEGLLVDSVLVSILNILGVTDLSADNVQQYCQINFFKPATYYDELRDKHRSGQEHDDISVFSTEQANAILSLPHFLQKPADFIPTIENTENLSLIVLMGLVKPTIDLRLEGIQRLEQLYNFKNIYLGFPQNVSKELLDYVRQFREEDMFQISSKTIDVSEEVIGLISKYSDEKLLILTDSNFVSKIDVICDHLGDRFVGCAYFGKTEREKAQYYGYNVEDEFELKAWVGNILNFYLARTFNTHYLKWKEQV